MLALHARCPCPGLRERRLDALQLAAQRLEPFVPAHRDDEPLFRVRERSLGDSDRFAAALLLPGVGWRGQRGQGGGKLGQRLRRSRRRPCLLRLQAPACRVDLRLLGRLLVRGHGGRRRLRGEFQPDRSERRFGLPHLAFAGRQRREDRNAPRRALQAAPGLVAPVRRTFDAPVVGLQAAAFQGQPVHAGLQGGRAVLRPTAAAPSPRVHRPAACTAPAGALPTQGTSAVKPEASARSRWRSTNWPTCVWMATASCLSACPLVTICASLRARSSAASRRRVCARSTCSASASRWHAHLTRDAAPTGLHERALLAIELQAPLAVFAPAVLHPLRQRSGTHRDARPLEGKPSSGRRGLRLAALLRAHQVGAALLGVLRRFASGSGLGLRLARCRSSFAAPVLAARAACATDRGGVDARDAAGKAPGSASSRACSWRNTPSPCFSSLTTSPRAHPAPAPRRAPAGRPAAP